MEADTTSVSLPQLPNALSKPSSPKGTITATPPLTLPRIETQTPRSIANAVECGNSKEVTRSSQPPRTSGNEAVEEGDPPVKGSSDDVPNKSPRKAASSNSRYRPDDDVSEDLELSDHEEALSKGAEKGPFIFKGVPVSPPKEDMPPSKAPRTYGGFNSKGLHTVRSSLSEALLKLADAEVQLSERGRELADAQADLSNMLKVLHVSEAASPRQKKKASGGGAGGGGPSLQVIEAKLLQLQEHLEVKLARLRADRAEMLRAKADLEVKVDGIAEAQKVSQEKLREAVGRVRALESDKDALLRDKNALKGRVLELLERLQSAEIKADQESSLRSSMANKIADKQALIDELERRVAEVSDKTSTSQNMFRSLTNHVTSIESTQSERVDALQQQVRALTDENARLKGLSDDAVRDVARLRDEESKNSAALQAAQSELASCRALMERGRLENDVLRTEAQQLNATIEQLRQEGVRAHGDVTTLKLEYRKAQDETAALTARIARLTTEVEGAKTKALNAGAEKEAMRRELLVLQDQVDTAAIEATRVEDDRQRLRVEVQRCQREVDSYKADLQRSRRDRDTLKADLLALQEEVDAVRREGEQHKDVGEETLNRLKRAEKRCESLAAELERAHLESDQLRTELLASEEARAAAASDADKARTEGEALAAKLARLQKELERTRGDVREARERSDAADAEVHGCREEIGYLREQMRSWQEQAEAVRAEVSRRDDELQRLTATIQSLRWELSTSNDHCQRLRDHVESLAHAESSTAELHRVKADLAMLSGAAMAAKEQAQVVAEENHKLREDARQTADLLESLRNDLQASTRSAASSEEVVAAMRNEVALMKSDKVRVVQQNVHLTDANLQLRQQLDALTKQLTHLQLELDAIRTAPQKDNNWFAGALKPDLQRLNYPYRFQPAA